VLFFLGGIGGACSDDDNGASTDDGGVDVAVQPDGPPRDTNGEHDVMVGVDVEVDGPPPSTDPCSGNTYTPTAPSTGTGTAPGDANAEQIEAMEYMNTFRNLTGLNPIDLNSALNQAAQAHSDYCSTNSDWCPGWHSEEPGHPGFTGENFGDRCAAAGYSGQPVFEVMAPGGGDPVYAIDMWMATVYHRTPFVTPEVHEAGYGSGSAYTTMDFGCCGSVDPDLVTNYPVHEQTGFPASWSGNEGPQPPTPPSGWPSGPVITIVFPSINDVSITAHEIYDDACTPIAHVAGGADISPNPGFELSFLRSTVVLYPDDPLASGQTYTVNVEYTRGGVGDHRTFTFTTQ
jgi:uncharacterized protein YkwD